MEIDLERSKKLIEPNQALTLHIIKNRCGDKGKLAFEFVPAFSKFTEVAPASSSHADSSVICSAIPTHSM